MGLFLFLRLKITPKYLGLRQFRWYITCFFRAMDLETLLMLFLKLIPKSQTFLFLELDIHGAENVMFKK